MSIAFEIKKVLLNIDDPNEKLQFLQGVINECQLIAQTIQSKHQVPFVEIPTDDVEVKEEEIKDELPTDAE